MHKTLKLLLSFVVLLRPCFPLSLLETVQRCTSSHLPRTHTRTEITKSVRARSKQSKSPAWRTRPLFATLAMAAFFPLIFSLPVCSQRYLCCKEVQCDVTRQPTNRGALHPPSFVFQPSGIMRAALNDLGDVPGAKDIVYCVLLRSFSISPPSNHCPSGSASPPPTWLVFSRVRTVSIAQNQSGN